MPEIAFTSSVKQFVIVRNQYSALVVCIDRDFVVYSTS